MTTILNDLKVFPYLILTNFAAVTPVPVEDDPCRYFPCGPNAECQRGGICTCIPGYEGDPYSGCRPECILNTDCTRNRACIKKKCLDPCPGTCGQNALCEVLNHIPICKCPENTSGNPFVSCDAVIIGNIFKKIFSPILLIFILSNNRTSFRAP